MLFLTLQVAVLVVQVLHSHFFVVLIVVEARLEPATRVQRTGYDGLRVPFECSRLRQITRYRHRCQIRHALVQLRGILQQVARRTNVATAAASIAHCVANTANGAARAVTTTHASIRILGNTNRDL